MNVYIVHTVFRVNHDQHAINKHGELYIYIDVLLVHMKLDAMLMPFVCGSLDTLIPRLSMGMRRGVLCPLCTGCSELVIRF